MRLVKISVGRTIDLGDFGRTETGKAWFAVEAEVESSDTPEDVEASLNEWADRREREERERFDRDRKTNANGRNPNRRRE